MKKTKLFAVLGLLFAMGVTACNNSSEQPAEESTPAAESQSQSKSQSSQEHKKHTWDNGEITTPAGCEDGVKTYKCTFEGCNETKTEVIPGLGHQWGTATPVEAAEDCVAYNKFSCTRDTSKCQAMKYEIALDGIPASGDLTSDLPSGFVKLGSNGKEFSFKFNASEAGSGKLYLRGAMDHWDSQGSPNNGRTLFSGKDGNEPVEKDTTNLEIKMNNTALVCTNKSTMEQMLPAIDADHPAAASSYSAVGDMEFAPFTMNQGVNEINFKRVDSFNPAVSHIVLVFTPAA